MTSSGSGCRPLDFLNSRASCQTSAAWAPSGARLAEISRVADTCGYGVPLFRYEGQRSQLLDWAERKGPEDAARYRAEHNATSLEGLPALRCQGQGAC